MAFRSKSPLGPFLAYEHNPILTQRDLPNDRKNPITSAGHAQFVQGPDGQTYAIFLAVRPYEDNYYNTGRETFMRPLRGEMIGQLSTPTARKSSIATSVNTTR